MWSILKLVFKIEVGTILWKFFKFLETIKFSPMLFSPFQKFNLKAKQRCKGFKCGCIYTGLYPLFYACLNLLEILEAIWFLFSLHVQVEFEFKTSNKPSEKCLEIIFLGSEILLKFICKVSQLLYFYYYF